MNYQKNIRPNSVYSTKRIKVNTSQFTTKRTLSTTKESNQSKDISYIHKSESITERGSAFKINKGKDIVKLKGKEPRIRRSRKDRLKC